MTSTEVQNLEKFKQFMSNRVSEEATMWLAKNGFFKAPASSKYHGSYEGGLFDHSLNVAVSLVTLSEANGLSWERESSPYIIGMLHDLCKIDQYLFDPIFKKYVWNKDAPRTGHGDKSVYYIEEHICSLTDEEKECIRWHMGAFDEKENWTKYSNAIHKFCNVLWTHHADMIAAHILEQ